MAIAVYSDKAREGKQGKSLRLREKGAESYAGGRPSGRASLSGRARGSDSPYVETIMHGRTLSDDSSVRPAECHWHMVFVKKDGEARVVFVGPWTTTGVAHYTEGAEILWIKFGLGTFMPHMPSGSSQTRRRSCLMPRAGPSGWRAPRGSSPATRTRRRSSRGSCGVACWSATRWSMPHCGGGLKSCRPGRCGTASCGQRG